MIEAHFGLRRRPFPASPDHSCYYPATGHERALHRLLAGLEDGEGMLLLTGAPGTGKTLLAHCLIDRLGDGVECACLTHGHTRDRAGLLQAILYDLALPHEGRHEQELRLRLTEHLLKRYSEGRRTVLLIDEAQHLGTDLLEELRMLGNLEGRSGKAVQVVLIGQPEVCATLDDARLASLRQRLAVRAGLEALGVEEAADYLLHHLRSAGARAEQVLGEEALELLARNTHGVPRLLNQAAGLALRLAAEAGLTEIDVEVALEALTALGLPGTLPDGPDGEAGVLLVEQQADENDCRVFLPPGRTA
jgi:type II secretory pathway predicted ATPase ExeA